MPYRDATACDDPLISAREELLAAAAQGRRRLQRLAEVQQRAHSIAAAKQKRDEARAQLRRERAEARKMRRVMARSCRRLGLLASGKWIGGWYMFGAFVMVQASVPLLIGGQWWFLWPVAAWALAPLVALLASSATLRHTIARERRWAARLPFPLTGHPECLGRETKRLRATLAFRRVAARPDLVRDLAAAYGLINAGDPAVTAHGTAVTLTSPAGGRSLRLDHDNRGLCLWVRGLAQMLTRLHEVHPLESVTLSTTES